MRMTMRLAYATVNPVTIMQPTAVMTGTNPQRWPFGAVLPVGATGNPTGALGVVQAPPYPYTGSFMVAGEASEPSLENEQELEALQAQEAAAKATEEDARAALHSRRRAAAPRQSGRGKE